MLMIFLIYLLSIVLFIITLYPFISPQNRQIFGILVGISIVVISGIRYGIGFDYTSYEEMFFYTPEFIEPGFSFLINLIKLTGGENFPLFILLISFFNFAIFHLALLRNIPKKFLPISYCFFITTNMYFFFLNGIRQAISISIILWGFKYIEKRNPIKFFLIIIFAAFFHKSSLIFLPFYYICKFINRRILLVGYFISFLGLFMKPEAFLLPEFISNSYHLYVSAGIIEDVRGQLSSYGYLKLIFPNIIFLYLYFCGYFEKCRERFLFYYSYIFFLNLFLFTPVFNRIMYYFEPGFILLIPNIWSHDKNPKVLFILIGIYYFIFSIISITMLRTHGCYPFLTIFD